MGQGWRCCEVRPAKPRQPEANKHAPFTQTRSTHQAVVHALVHLVSVMDDEMDVAIVHGALLDGQLQYQLGGRY